MFQEYLSVIAQGIPTSLLLTVVSLLIAFCLALFLTFLLSMENKWVKRANIHKHITFHCARHSFITNIMANGANIKTAASLAGHSTTRHTEKYVHIIDELKQKAVDSLPDIIVNYK